MKKHCLARTAAALSLAVIVTAGTLPSAGAADTERKYREQEITAYLYEPETSVQLKCLFYEDMLLSRISTPVIFLPVSLSLTLPSQTTATVFSPSPRPTILPWWRTPKTTRFTLTSTKNL